MAQKNGSVTVFAGFVGENLVEDVDIMSVAANGHQNGNTEMGLVFDNNGTEESEAIPSSVAFTKAGWYADVSTDGPGN